MAKTVIAGPQAAQKSVIPDPIQAGLSKGWAVFGGAYRPAPNDITCDVAIVGTGAGAGVTADILSQAGLSVVMVEEGPLHSSSDFRQLEAEAYPSLYQESAARQTADKAITILQGRCVGGSTTVNWTSSFRTPVATLEYWQRQFGLATFNSDALAPYFQQAESRLNIGPWLAAPNENNDLLRRGAAKLGIPAAAILRNVKGCWNLGSCGMGCPTNAKQSMLVTTVPAALDRGAQLLVQTTALKLEFAQGQVNALVCASVAGSVKTAVKTRIRAKHYVVAGGAINSPALLLRSGTPDPHGLLGKRTFLHPVVMSGGIFAQKVEGWYGAPQTIYTDHFLDTQPIDGPMGYKLEAPPLHPVIFAGSIGGMGAELAQAMRDFPNTHVLLALLRDGFHDESVGGHVKLRSDGSPVLDYQLTRFVMDGARRALLSMAEIQFAAGAREVQPVHEMAQRYNSWVKAREAIESLDLKPLLLKVVSAHVMGGCGMAADERRGVVQADGTHWQIENLSVHDGSVFPTSIGANPQLSIYGVVNRMAQGLALKLAGRAPNLHT